jgi:hypothetical protein
LVDIAYRICSKSATMAAVQLHFSLRTSSNVKTVHLLGSWDSYSGQLPLSRDGAKAGAWQGTFRFQGFMLKAGQRYWYYYIIDGYHVSHDPAAEYTVEPTTGRKLNVLDVPRGSAAPSHHKRNSTDVPLGRGLSPSRILHPKPSKPYASRQLRETDFASPTVDELAARFAEADISDSDSDLSCPSISSSRSSNTSPSSVSSLSDSGSRCSCQRYGITRRGERIKIDCGGRLCGNSESDSCSSESEREYGRAYPSRRHAVVVHR